MSQSGEVCVVSEKCYVCPCSVIAASRLGVMDCGRAEGPQQGAAYRPGATPTLSRRDDLNHVVR
jgi:hypothetical protein